MTVGIDATRRALESGLVRLVVVAEDASKTQLAKLERPIERAGVEIRSMSGRDTLGHALGVASVSAVGITSQSFASQLSQALDPRTPDSPDGESEREAQEERRSDAGR